MKATLTVSSAATFMPVRLKPPVVLNTANTRCSVQHNAMDVVQAQVCSKHGYIKLYDVKGAPSCEHGWGDTP
jgi:hypothetical protein